MEQHWNLVISEEKPLITLKLHTLENAIIKPTKKDNFQSTV